MKYAVIACKVLARELYLYAARSANTIDIILLKQNLHNEPEKLKERLQKAIDDVEADDEKYDAILLGYCLCSNGIIGVKSKKYPLVVARGHDCITLLLGSRFTYQDYFDNHKGIYWYTAGWIERTLMPGKERYESLLQKYIEKYGEDNAEYLMEMEQAWFKDYNWATYIKWNELHNDSYMDYTQECADYLNWNRDIVEGSPELIRDMLEGNWDKDRFAVAPPGKAIRPTYDGRILEAED